MNEFIQDWNVLDKTVLVQDNLCESKDAYDGGEVTCRLFSAPKIQYCLTIDEYAKNDEHRTFKGFTDTEKIINWSQNFVMLKNNKTLLIHRSVGKNYLLKVLLSLKSKILF